MDFEKLEKINIIYGENLSGKTKLLEDLYKNLDINSGGVSDVIKRNCNIPTIYFPVSRIFLENWDVDFNQIESDNVHDYLINRKELFEKKNLSKVFIENIKSFNPMIKEKIEKFFNISIDEEISTLSDGVISIMAIVSEMEKIKEYELEEVLILIDELDAYLYPRQQVEILNFLSEYCENATFIITTHSPLLTKNAISRISEYKIIKENLIKLDTDNRNDINIMIDERFDIKPYSSQVTEFTDLIFKILHDSNYISNLQRDEIIEIKIRLESSSIEIKDNYKNEYAEFEYYYKLAIERLEYASY